MKLQVFSVFALGLVADSALGLRLQKRDNPSVVSLDLVKREKLPQGALQKRARAPYSVTLKTPLQRNAYYVNYTLGTPPQNLYAQVDTGSSHLLVFTPDVQTCTTGKVTCEGGIFQYTKSSTYTPSTVGKNGAFGSGNAWTARGSLDTLNIGGIAVQNYTFGALISFDTKDNHLESVMGFGLIAGEQLPDNLQYPNVPAAVAKSGAIKKAAFSIQLSQPGTSNGLILLGGVNKAKYTGPLKTMDILVDNETKLKDRALVLLTGVSFAYNGTSKDTGFTPRAVLLDTGATRSSLPDIFLTTLIQVFGGAYDPVTSTVVAPCSARDTNATVDYAFGDLTIKVPIREYLQFGQELFNDGHNVGAGGREYCFVQINHTPLLVLGDEFLRSAYAVFDYDDMTISLAQANPGGTPDDIHEIVSDIPGATAETALPSSFLGFHQSASSILSGAPSGATSLSLTSLSTSHDLAAIATSTSSAASTGTGSSTSTSKPNAAAGKMTDMSYFALVASLLGAIFAF